MNKKNWLIFTTLFFYIVAFTACQSVPEIGTEITTESGSYRVVTVSELQMMLDKKDFIMVNVHTPWSGDITQTDLRIPYDQIEQNLTQLPPKKDAKILVYCLTSGMAKKAVATLTSQGYTNLWMLGGGTTAWVETGFSLIKD